MEQGVPIFVAGEVEIVRDHNNNSIGDEFEQILRQGNEFVLNIGARGTAERYPNCIEFEQKIFRHTDVVGDAHHLPFRDAVFDRVFAFNVFEHLRDPKSAAAEILRVLKPGGSVAIHTAFLQALREEPTHFFNATEFGVREWFSDFEVERCVVSGNFGPGVMLGFLAANLLEVVKQSDAPWKEQMSIADTTIGEWANFWTGQAEPPIGFSRLQGLPQHLQKRIAAGFELIAKKPERAGR
jgi:SAM-dependent methyltransferase